MRAVLGWTVAHVVRPQYRVLLVVIITHSVVGSARLGSTPPISKKNKKQNLASHYSLRRRIHSPRQKNHESSKRRLDSHHKIPRANFQSSPRRLPTENSRRAARRLRLARLVVLVVPAWKYTTSSVTVVLFVHGRQDLQCGCSIV